MQVPTVRFMDLYVYPTSTLEIAHKEHQVHIRALGTSIEGSHHIESLNCNERFMLNLSVNLRAEDDMCASSLRLPNVRLERLTQIGPGSPPQHTRHTTKCWALSWPTLSMICLDPRPMHGHVAIGLKGLSHLFCLAHSTASL
jgi:hypothetical protein